MIKTLLCWTSVKQEPVLDGRTPCVLVDYVELIIGVFSYNCLVLYSSKCLPNLGIIKHLRLYCGTGMDFF